MGCVVITMIETFGPFSGAHMNPAVDFIIHGGYGKNIIPERLEQMTNFELLIEFKCDYDPF